MKCYCITKFSQPLELIERETPQPEGTEVLLKTRAAGVCHSDLHIWEGGYDLGHGKRLSLQERGIKLPLTMGHETVGTPVAMGAQANGVEPGRNYLVFPWIGCGQCDVCQSGQENYCATPRSLGIYTHGGYADHILVPHSRYLLDIGDLNPAEIAPHACSGLTTYSAINKIDPAIHTKHPIFIVGAGGLGLMAIEILRAMGGHGAIVVDIDPAKLQAAKNAGALAVVNGNDPDAAQQVMAANGGKQLHAVIDLVGSPSSTQLGFNVLTKGGTLVIVGLFGGAAPWPLAFIPMRALRIQGSYTGSLNELKSLLELVKAGKINSIPVTTHPLAEASDVLARLHEGKVIGRAVLVD
ncbi:alcohol dehydrogenase [Orrella daihaiensis]|uniref:alcohol dehydrogenase n=1 Tax=Orrella daihaiensis TaxID=2782176 RepID=A0ABY4AI26_9BURK|nr:alcohol dehydrogenase [Orrella daihaiensis]UOD49578.1 alcohol dehydrogenase catalytic domain-containing protein [Orrella daihaiensis]